MTLHDWETGMFAQVDSLITSLFLDGISSLGVFQYGPVSNDILTLYLYQQNQGRPRLNPLIIQMARQDILNATESSFHSVLCLETAVHR